MLRNIILFSALSLFIFSCISETKTKENETTEIKQNSEITADTITPADFEPTYIEQITKLANLIQQEHSYKLVAFKDWSTSYLNNTKTKTSDEFSFFVEIQPSIWKTMDKNDHSVAQIQFEHTKTVAMVLKSTTKSALKPDVKIVQIQFPDKEAAQNAFQKFPDISYFILDDRGMKSPNSYWIHDKYIYIARVRAAAFDPIFPKKIFDSHANEF